LAAATWQFRAHTAKYKEVPGSPLLNDLRDRRPAARRRLPTASYDDWRKLVDGVLKGAPFEKLVGKTYDGLKIDPIYRRAKGVTPIAGREAAAPWQIMQRSTSGYRKSQRARAA